MALGLLLTSDLLKAWRPECVAYTSIDTPNLLSSEVAEASGDRERLQHMNLSTLIDNQNCRLARFSEISTKIQRNLNQDSDNYMEAAAPFILRVIWTYQP